MLSLIEPASIATPFAHRFGLAFAIHVGIGRVHCSELWTQVMGDAIRALPRQSRTVGVRFELASDAAGMPVALATGQGLQARAWCRVLAPHLAVSERTDPVVSLIYAPSREPDFAAQIARVYQLGARDAETFSHLIVSRDLNHLAALLGLSRPGVRKRVEALYRATGTTSLSGLLATTTRWLGDQFAANGAIERALKVIVGLTSAQARAGALLAEGWSLSEVADRLNLSGHTVRDHARAALAKAGVDRRKDFSRLAHECAALYCLASGSLNTHPDDDELLTVTRIMRRRTRQIGFADYGPPGAEPVVIFHGGMGMRRIGRHLRSALHDQGFRPLIVERPGFGLTDPGDHPDTFATAAEDLVSVLDWLGLEDVAVLGFDAGAAPAICFGAAAADRVKAGILVAPRPPPGGSQASSPQRAWFVTQVTEAICKRPQLIADWWRVLRTKASPHLVQRLCERLFSGHPADRACLADETFLQILTATLLTCGARTAEGISSELLAYRNWQPDPAASKVAWTILAGDGDPLWGAIDQHEGTGVWAPLQPRRFSRLVNGGRFLATTHAKEIAREIVGALDGGRQGVQQVSRPRGLQLFTGVT